MSIEVSFTPIQPKVEDLKPVEFTDAAAAKALELIAEDGNAELRLRVYVSGGGCSGFQYGFELDDKVADDDIEVVNGDAIMLLDPMSMQYLAGSKVDYIVGLEGSRFVIENPNAKTTCGCGSSFSI